MMSKHILDIQGMTCQNCAAHIEKDLNKTPGVAQAQVSFVTKQAIVQYDESKISPQEMIDVIQLAGYQVVNPNKPLSKANDPHIGLGALAMALSFAVVLFYFAMGSMWHWPYTQLGHSLGYLQAVLCLPILWISRSILIRGWMALWHRAPHMDSLIALGATSAFGYSLWLLLWPHASHGGHYYFESTGVLLALVLLGRFIEDKSRTLAQTSLHQLLSLSPQQATVLRHDTEMTISASEIHTGETLVVKAGQVIACDGIVIFGHSTVDESMLTGEPLPVTKTIHDTVMAGSVNHDGLLHIQVTQNSEQSFMHRIVEQVQEALLHKAPIARLADKISFYFVPSVIILALIAGLTWALVTHDVAFSLTIAVSILVISCPCALGLATPMALLIATTRAAKQGILVKHAGIWETIAKVDILAVDKTGTITQGQPECVHYIFADESQKNRFLPLICAVQSQSHHPLAISMAHLDSSYRATPTKFQAIGGQGITASLDGHELLIGQSAWLQQHGIDTQVSWLADDWTKWQAHTQTWVAIDGLLIAVFFFADTLKPDSIALMNQLKAMSIRTCILSGDQNAVVQQLAQTIQADEAYGQLLPQQKVEKIQQWQQAGHKVAFLGDGINDAPALAQSNVGLAVHGSTDLASESASVVFLYHHLALVSKTIALGKSTLRIIKQNLFWAFSYNIIGLPLAAGVFYLFGGPLLNPMFAGFAMGMSSVLVILNALRIR